jgi:NhaP-type Na+/H+ or K+/H+ antiporter
MNTDLILGFLYCFGVGIAVGLIVGCGTWWSNRRPKWTDKQIKNIERYSRR